MWPRASVVALLTLLVAGGAARGQATAHERDPALIANLLRSDNAAHYQQGLGHVRAWLASEPSTAVSHLRYTWAKALADAGRHADAADLALAAVLAVPHDAASVEAMQRLRAESLLKAGRPRQALAAARSLYNVAATPTTSAALLLLIECLNADAPLDFARIDRLRAEQVAGATTHPVAPRTSPTLLAIAAETDIYLPAARQRSEGQYLIRGNELQELMAEANLLLLAGRAAQARPLFRRALDMADGAQLHLYEEHVARALKAEDGTIGRANALLQGAKIEEDPAPARTPRPHATSQGAGGG